MKILRMISRLDYTHTLSQAEKKVQNLDPEKIISQRQFQRLQEDVLTQRTEE